MLLLAPLLSLAHVPLVPLARSPARRCCRALVARAAQAHAGEPPPLAPAPVVRVVIKALGDAEPRLALRGHLPELLLQLKTTNI